MSDICVQTKVHNAYAGTYENPQPYWQEIPNLPLSAKLEFDTIFEAVIEDRRNCAYRIGKLDKTHAWYANAPKVTRGKGIGVGILCYVRSFTRWEDIPLSFKPKS